LLDIEDEKLLHIPLFPESHDDHRRGEKIRIKVKNDISKRNYMPCTIDELKVFGRNIEIQSIVENLNSDSDKIKTKMIHIFGSDGVGKTAIALNAAKYAFERRFFSVGAFYIDFASKT
jgi:Cdc6-like AAA superfamily ATPase